MTDSHRHSHWRSLAELLGAELPPDVEPPAAEEFLEQPAQPADAAQPALPPNVAEASTPTEPQRAAEHSPQEVSTPQAAPPPATAAQRITPSSSSSSTAAPRSSWDSLAEQLGLPVPPRAPEPTTSLTSAPASAEPPAPPARRETGPQRPQRTEQPRTEQEFTDPETAIAPAERESERSRPPRSRRGERPRRGEREDRARQVDAPRDVPPRSPVTSDWRAHQGDVTPPLEDIEDIDERDALEEPLSWDVSPTSVDFEAEDVDEVDDLDDVDAAVDDEAASDGEDEQGQRPRRRRRRRRRRGRRERTEGGEERSERAERTGSEKGPGPGGRSTKHGLDDELDADLEVERVEELDVELAEVDDEEEDEDQYIPPRGRTSRAESLRAEDEMDGDDESDDSEEMARPKHTKIPTWEQAIGMIIDANLASRTRSPQNYGRGRGRGRGPRR